MTDSLAAKPIFEPDMSLIRAWSVTVAKAVPHPSPYVAAFGSGNSQLKYIAARHHGDIDSPTLRTVKSVFEEFNPQVVIVEGVPGAGVASPSWYLQYAKLHEKTGFRHGGGETAYAATLAASRGIDFVPAEPSDKAKCDGLIAQGFTMRDFLGWNTCQMLHGHKNLTAQSGYLISQNIVNVTNAAGLPAHDFGIDEFKAWYAEKMRTPFSFDTVAKDNLSPSKNGTFMQRVTQAIDNVREPHIVKTVAEQLAKFDRVLVVYGSSHLAKQEPVLEKMLGKPQYSKPF